MLLLPSPASIVRIAKAGVAGLLLLFPLPSVALSADETDGAFYSAAIFDKAVIPVSAATLRGLQTVSGPARLPASVLEFRRTWKAEQAARDRLLDSLLATTDDPVDRERISRSVANDEIWRKFDRLLSFAGYSSRNLADVTTAYYVIAWEVVRDGQAIDYLGGVRQVRDSVADALLHAPDLIVMSDADKQEAAVAMAYLAIVSAHRVRELREAGDRAGEARLREQVRRAVLRGQGVDLATLRLTNLGFVAD
ncbi:MAG: hypothetical protein RLO51_18340 [Thalassobaculum sp.]|uniref:hypothetical protein n=1 Tax=Thalassobaculum sp. TaxID=2022740 RepID=UPI0032ED7E14